jgi:hypothetical protein
MRQIFFKTTDNELIDYQTNLISFELSQEDPYGINYGDECSSVLSVEELNEWWDYVDKLLLEHPTPNFMSVWRIIDNGILYGYEN